MNKIIGCGIDIEEPSRFKDHIPTKTATPGISSMVFTREEIKCNQGIFPHLTFPLAFSCKEAFFKAFGVSWTNSRISWKDIELLFNNEKDLTDYSVQLNGYALELFQQNKCTKMESSMECADEYIIFQVILFA